MRVEREKTLLFLNADLADLAILIIYACYTAMWLIRLTATADDVLCNVKLYQELTGSLNHLAVFSRPDITFAVSKLSKYNSNPTTTHLKSALHVLRYLKSTRNYCIVYRKSTDVPITDVIAYSGSEHGSDEDDRKSYTSYMFTINGGAVSWSTHKQSTVAFSSMEAEYMALSDAS
jgi:hypothetical protein